MKHTSVASGALVQTCCVPPLSSTSMFYAVGVWKCVRVSVCMCVSVYVWFVYACVCECVFKI